jgi:hypothetical protein
VRGDDYFVDDVCDPADIAEGHRCGVRQGELATDADEDRMEEDEVCSQEDEVEPDTDEGRAKKDEKLGSASKPQGGVARCRGERGRRPLPRTVPLRLRDVSPFDPSRV